MRKEKVRLQEKENKYIKKLKLRNKIREIKNNKEY